MSTTPFLPLPAPLVAPLERSGAAATTHYRAVVLTSIRDIDAARWDELVGTAAVTRSHAYLDAIESASLNECRYYYPVVYDEHNELVAHACVYTIVTDFAQLLPARQQRWVHRLRRWWPRLFTVKITECASPFVAGHALTIRAGAERERVLRELDLALAGIAQAERSWLIVIRDFLEPERAAFDGLLAHGFQPRLNLPLARIRVRWASYADYLGAMRARYRKDVKRRLQRAQASGQQVEVMRAFGQHADTWAAQAAVVLANAQRFKRERVGPGYYRNMERKLGDHSVLLVARRNGRIVAHGLVLTDSDNTVATFFGREAGRPNAEWFSLMNEVIRLGIERRSRYIHLGLGSYAAKNLVGADIEPLYVYCRTTSRLLNALLRLLPEVMKPRAEPTRRIFHD